MKQTRYLVLIVLLVTVLGIAACSAAIPSAFAVVDGFVLNRHVSAIGAPVAAAAVQMPATRSTTAALVGDDLQSRLEGIYAKANPAVVNIQVLSQPTGLMNRLPNSLRPNAQNGDNSASDLPLAQGVGSGFVWDQQGHIVTNNHVVDGAQKVTVTFADGATVPATVIGRDPESDLAVIKVDSQTAKLQPIAIGDSSQVKVGQFAIAIGNPFGLEGSMSFGIVSALGRSLPASGTSSSMSGANYTIPDIIQTDAPVNPGNSGGVLLDLEGNVIGVPSAIESPVQGSAGVGFAIPSAIVKQVVPALIQDGKYIHPWIGISGTTLTPAAAQEMGLAETQRGALVIDVTKDSPADKAGLLGSTKQAQIDGQQVRLGGDVITAIEGQPVNRFEDLVTYLARSGKVGQAVKLTVLRDGKASSVTATLTERPSAQVTTRSNQQPRNTQPSPRGNQQSPAVPNQDTPAQPQRGSAWLGVSGIAVTPELAKAMKLTDTQTGALIQEVVTGSPAEKAGLKAGTETYDLNGQSVMIGGDIIVKAGSQTVTTMNDLAKIVQAQKAGDKLNLIVVRGGAEVKVIVTLGTRTTN